MSGRVPHVLEMDREEIITHQPSEYLALVDLESYPSFAGEETDRLDMMAHLNRQSTALRAVAWSAPSRALRLRFVLTDDYFAEERAELSRHSATASGWVRTQGRLCLTSHDPLFQCAQDRTRGLLDGAHLPKLSRPRAFAVPPGIFSVLIYYHFDFAESASPSHPMGESSADYTVILRHYPFPPPRVAPERRGSLIPWAVSDPELAARPFGL